MLTEHTAVDLDPNHSPGAALLALGRFNVDTSIVSDALSTHLRTTTGEVHSYLSRLQLAIGELRHIVMQPEPHVLVVLRKSIAAAVSPQD
jgi:hypothetical protein